jgi:hypothetical protein
MRIIPRPGQVNQAWVGGAKFLVIISQVTQKKKLFVKNRAFFWLEPFRGNLKMALAQDPLLVGSGGSPWGEP